MARPLRVELPGSVYHVTARGNDRTAIFRDDLDREKYLERLGHYRERYRFRVLAYCLMSNHVHLALRTNEIPLSRVMAGLQSSYTQWFNRRHRRCGHLFQGRYKAFLVQDDRYLLSLIKYIHENPVKAGVVRSAEGYVWSSDGAYRGRRGPSWLDTGDVLEMLGGSRAAALAAYRRVMKEDAAPRYEDEPAVGGQIKGEEGFATRVLSEADEEGPARFIRGLTADRVLTVLAGSLGIDPSELASPRRRRDLTEARAIAGYLGKALGGIPWSRMARRLGRDGSTLVRDVGRLEQRLRDDVSLRRKIKAVEAAIRVA